MEYDRSLSDNKKRDKKNKATAACSQFDLGMFLSRTILNVNANNVQINANNLNMNEENMNEANMNRSK